MKHSQRGAGILLNYLTEGVRVLSVLLVTPAVLRFLGQQEYGLYQMAVSLVSGLGLLNVGFGSAYLRHYSRYLSEGKMHRIPDLNGMFLLIFSLLACLCLLGGWLLAHGGTGIFGKGLSFEELEKARKLILLLTVSLAITLLGSVFDCQLLAREQFVFQKLLRLLQTLLNPLLTLPLLLLGYGSEAMVLVSLLLCAGVTAGNGFYCRNRLHMRVSFQDLPLSELRELWGFVFFLFLNQMIDQVNWSVDKFLLGRMSGTAAVAVYSVGGQINTLYVQMSTAISAVFAPKVNRMAAQSADNEELSCLMASVGRGQMMVLGLILTGFALFGKEFLALWAGPGYEEAYTVALLLMVPVTVPLIQNIGLEILRARNRHRARSLVCAALAAGNILLSITLIPKFGASGAAVGTAIALAAGNVLFMNWYYRSRLKLNMSHFRKELQGILPALCGALAAGRLLKSGFCIRSWWQLLVFAGLYAMGYAVIFWRFALNNREKQGLKAMLRKKEKGDR